MQPEQRVRPLRDQAGRKTWRTLLVTVLQNGLGGPQDGWKTLLGLEPHVAHLPTPSEKAPGAEPRDISQ